MFLGVAKFFFFVKITFQSSMSAPHICETVLQVLMAGRILELQELIQYQDTLPPA